MDRTKQEGDPMEYMNCDSPRTSELNILSAKKFRKNQTPLSKLCFSLAETSLKTPLQNSRQITDLEHVETTPQLSDETPVQSDSSLCLAETPRSHTSFESPLCTPLQTPRQKDVSSTPRRNPRRSSVFRKKTTEYKDDRHEEAHISKRVSDIVENTSLWSDVDMIDNDTAVAQQVGKINQSVTAGTKSPLIDAQERPFVDNASLWAPSLVHNNLETNTNGKTNQSKEQYTGSSSRKLSFSAKKQSNKRKSGMREYDPDNDIFAQGLVPIQYNVDSLKTEIGKFLGSSVITSQKLERSSSCGALNDKCTEDISPTHGSMIVPPKKNRTKQSTRSPPKTTFKRASSAPDLCAAATSTEKHFGRVTPEGTLRAFLRARDIIRSITERKKKICNSTSQAVDTANKGEPSLVNAKQIAGCSNNLAGKNNLLLETEDFSQDLPPTQSFELLILQGVTAYVEVISNNEDISAGVKTELTKLGATVVPQFTKDVPVTHVVFNDGYISTYQKAKKRNIPLVSVLWIEECRKARKMVHESFFPPYQIERYESPSMIKQLKKRRIMRFCNDEKPRASPRRKKVVPANQTLAGISEVSSKEAAKSCLQEPKWVKEVAGNNGMVRMLVNVAGIKRSEFKDIVNRPSSPDSDLDATQSSPLPVRLLRKLTRNINAPTDADKSNAVTECDRIKCVSPPCANPSLGKCFGKNLDEMVLKEKEPPGNQNISASDTMSVSEPQENTLTLPSSFSPLSLPAPSPSRPPLPPSPPPPSLSPPATYPHANTFSSSSLSDYSNVSQRKRVEKRKLLTVVNETVLVEGSAETCPVINFAHESAPKRLSGDKWEEKRKQENTSVVQSQIRAHPKEGGVRGNRCEMGSFGQSVSEPIRRSRRSSAYFVKNTKRSAVHVDQKPAVVCTLLHSEEVDVVASVITTLGHFVLETNVNSQTTHIVAGAPKRTMKLLKGMVRGCWIVAQEWVLKSLEAGKWLDEEEFEVTSFSPAIQKYRLEKLSFGTLFKPDIFSNCGHIFVSSRCTAPRGDLVEIIVLCGGKIVSRASKANIVVGKQRPEVVCVTDLWVLDSVMYYCCKSYEPYLYT